MTDIEHSDGTCHCLADCAGPPEAKSEEFVVERLPQADSQERARDGWRRRAGAADSTPRTAHRGWAKFVCDIERCSCTVRITYVETGGVPAAAGPAAGHTRVTETDGHGSLAGKRRRATSSARANAATRGNGPGCSGNGGAASVERVSTVAGRPAPGTPATCSAAAAWS